MIVYFNTTQKTFLNYGNLLLYFKLRE